jgi:hypothetical protein
MSTTTTNAPSLIEQSIEILDRSRDGNDLEPFHLSLVQAAVNNHLTARGVDAFHQLYDSVTSGQYAKPWLAGVEHVTRDHQGYIYWKGSRIEHFTFSVMEEDQLKHTTQRLAERCRHIEALGLPVCGHSYFNDWLQEMPLDFPQAYKELLHFTGTPYEHEDGRAIFLMQGRTQDGWPVEARFLAVKDGAITERSLPVRLGDVEYHALTGQYGCRLARCGQAEHNGPGAASLAQILDWLRRHGITQLVAQQLVEHLKANLEAADAAGPTPCGAADQSTMRV